MQNLKIRVNRNNAGEAIDLLVNLGHNPLLTKERLVNELEHGNTYIVNTGNGLFTTKNHHDVKEITLPELRAMAYPMKEYLIPSITYEYILTDAREALEPHAKDWIEIPEGAEAFGYTGIVHTFYKDDFRSFFNENTDGQWDERSETCIGRKEPVILWQRATHPEELPFVDDEPKYTDDEVKYMDENGQGRLQSLNDQYAEIEKVRQDEKQERNSSAWDMQIGGDHYKQFKIQPMQFALENKLDAAQHNIIKYIMRHSFKNGKQDLEKAKHYIDLMIEFYYGENNNG